MDKKNAKIYVLNPSQSKRLIAKGVAALPQVQDALHNYKIFVGRGTTNAYILNELTDLSFNKGDYVAGQIIPGKTLMKWWVNKGNQIPEKILKNGKVFDVSDRVKEIYKFNAGDLVIKGANALDMNGVPAVVAGAIKGGGTIGTIQGTIQVKGIEVICPIGLEKLVMGNVLEIQTLVGVENMDMPLEGMPAGLIPMPYATVITEIEALELIFDCEVVHIASGGVGGAEGSISLYIQAFDGEEMKKIDSLMKEIAKTDVFIPNL